MHVFRRLTAACLIIALHLAAYGYDFKALKNENFIAHSPCLLGGFYLGSMIGYDSYWMRQNISLPLPADIGGNPRINAPGWVGGIFGGYGHYFWGWIYVGGEVLGNYSQANENYIISSHVVGTKIYSTRFDVHGSWGFSLLAGGKITSYLLGYMRFGLLWASFHTREDAFRSVSRGVTTQGPSYGLGLEVLAAPQWSLRGEYTHTNNDSFASIFHTNFDPSDNQVALGIIYHLG